MQAGGGRIAIVGAGFSGTALAVQLLRRGASVTLLERSGSHGPGLAYGTRCERHLLNVRSGRMSLFPDDESHFTRWLADAGLDADPLGFARRADYGRYIQSCLTEADAGAPGRLTKVVGDVVGIGLQTGGVVLHLADGRRVAAEQAVLATGNPPPGSPGLAGLEDLDGCWVTDPWGAGALDGIGPDADVVLAGTGLTAVDVLLALQARGWRGRALAISRRGLSPRTHERDPAPRLSVGRLPEGPVSQQLHAVRRRTEEASWPVVMDGLRPHGQALWGKADGAQRRRFLRHLRPWWDVHRHRMAPEVGAAIEQLRSEGRLRVAAGRLLGVEREGEGVAVTWRPRGAPDPERTCAAVLINCTGPQGDPSRAGEPLLDTLLSSGGARTDALRLGLDVDPSGRVLDREGRPQRRLWALGPLTRGTFWEIVAVPDIREQAAELADRLAPAHAATGFDPATSRATARPARVSHLDEVGQTYGEHMGIALLFGARLLGAGAACMVHAVAPWLFTKTASRVVTQLHGEMAARAKRTE